MMHKAQTRTADRLGRKMTACAAGLVFLSLGACGAEEDEGAASVGAQVGSAASLDGGTPASSDAAVAPDAAPPPAYTALVTATGSGCPEGSFESRVRDDGAIALSFADFKAAVDAQTTEVEKVCTIVVRLSAKSGASYAVTRYAHLGQATLEAGVEGKQSSSYYFPTARVTGRLRNSILIGPLDGPVRSEPLADADVMWTPCALEQSLSITTRLVLKSGDGGGKGTVSFGEGKDANAGVALDLGVRACTLPTPPAPR